MEKAFLQLFVTALVVLIAAPGCMVLDEIDAANAQMKSASKSRSDAGKSSGKTAKSAPSGSGDAAERSLLERSQRWWEGASSVTTERVDASIVRCRLASGSQFMARDDCLARGGQAGGV